MGSNPTDPQRAGLPRPVRGARRIAIAAGLAVGGALLAGAGVWVYSGTAAATDAPEGNTFTGATEEVTLGNLEGDTTVTGTLRYSDSRSIQAGADGTVTALPTPGSVITRGTVLYSVDNVPSFLLNGAMPAWRGFISGMDDGPDVEQLEGNLRDMGYFTATPDEKFRWATVQAIKAWQTANGQPDTGELPLGSVVFAGGDLRVGSISTGVGARVGPGAPVFEATATTQVVEANVKLALQQFAALDTRVTVQLPGGESTTGRISSVGTPTEIDGANGQKQTVIPIVISLDDPTRVAAFQEASVSVSIPSENLQNVLSVPVGALIAITPQQFGVEVVDADGSTTKVPVTTGLFAGGRVEISGGGITAGQRVVVPQR
jgi:multidrug efflux pump subunit AcrA (membrane-fusion protein)